MEMSKHAGKARATASWAGSEYNPADYAADIAKTFRPDAPMLLKGDGAEDATVNQTVPRTIVEVLQGLRGLVTGYCKMRGCDVGHIESAYKKVEDQVRMCRRDATPDMCQRMWTSTAVFELKRGDQHQGCLELCSILNRTLQCDGAVFSNATEDERRTLLKHAVVLCRGINTLLVPAGPTSGPPRHPPLSRMPSSERFVAQYLNETKHFPTNGTTYRGGGFNEDYQVFFKVGKQFRFPCYLSTSFDKDVAEGFRKRAFGRGFASVLWTVMVDKRGEMEPLKRCAHVNFVTKVAKKIDGKGKTKDEVKEYEWLFQHFAPFMIFKVKWSETAKTDINRPHEITIVAAQDGQKEPENLPLAPWS